MFPFPTIVVKLCWVSQYENNIFSISVAVVVAFFICWAPFHVQRLYTIYATFPKPDEKTHSLYLRIYELVTYISGVLYYVSATTNPILYSIMSVKFREAFKVSTLYIVFLVDLSGEA